MTAAPFANQNFSQAELDKFGALAQRWWDPEGPQKALHAMNPVRLAYVAGRTTLRDARVLDVGCGGGLLSEALAGEGAVVTAIDLSPEGAEKWTAGVVFDAGQHALLDDLVTWADALRNVRSVPQSA